MNTKLNNNILIQGEYKDLLSFKNNEERIEHNAQMISYKVLNEIEKLCEEKKIKKKDLAEMVGTSKSYITQLFNGSKSVNTYIMAKFQEALGITFEIHAKLNEESFEDFFHKEISRRLFDRNKFMSAKGSWFYRPNKEKTNDLIYGLETENKQLQKVA